MDVSVTWGRGKVDLSIPDENFAGLVKPIALEGREPGPEIEKAVSHPHAPQLEALCKGKNVCVLIEDDTRAEPHEEIIDSLSARLGAAKKVKFIITTGSHDVSTRGNREIMRMIEEAASRHGLNLEGIHTNDSFADDFVHLGVTKRGTPMQVNTEALDADLYVVGADMKNHYFAGYSNAVKDFLPGICGYATIERNHSWALNVKSTFGVHPLHPDPARRDNPLAQDMLEGERMIVGDKPVFTLATISSHGKLLWTSAGALEAVTSRGIEVVDRLASFRVERQGYAVVSPGGYPQDDSLYNAQRALELTKNAITDKGRVLLLADCENGIAPNEKAKENFYDRLTRPLQEVFDSIRSGYQLYSHKAYKFAELIQRLESIELYTRLGEKVLEEAHLSKADDPQGTIDGWLRSDPKARILFFDDANKIAVYGK